MDAKFDSKRKKPIACQECGAVEVWNVCMGSCNVCFMIHFLEFRHAMSWPLTDKEKADLGLIPQGR